MEKQVEANRLLSLCVKIASAFSMLCSAYIASSIISNPRKRAVPKERIILGLSCSDIFLSFFWFLTTWPIPSGSEYVYGAVGNTQTCSMQGFFIQLGIMIPMYNGFLALYCFLYVCMDWGRQRMKLVEIYGHILVLAFGLSTSIAGLALELYNSAWVVCFIAPLPRNCTQSFQSIDGTTNCIRGDNAIIYKWAFYDGIIWVHILLTFCCFLLIYLHVRKQEKKMEAYTNEYMANTAMNKASNSDSREVAFRGALYTGAFLITWIPQTIAASLRISSSWMVLEKYLPLAIMLTFLLPSQGVFNFLIYIQPAVSQSLKERKKKLARKEQAAVKNVNECTEYNEENEDI